jgi:dihydroneopterin aldolase
METLFARNDYLRVCLRNVTVDVRCGLHPWERYPERPNRLQISVELFAPLATGVMAGQGFIDYDVMRDFIRGLSARDHIDLLETIVDDIVEAAFRHPEVEACRVSVMKRDIFSETEAAGVEAFRTRASWQGLAKPAV